MCIQLRKDSFPNMHFSKLQPRSDGPFHVLIKINDNAYNIGLRGDYNVYTTFNATYLSTFVGDSIDEADSRSSPFQEGEDDAGGTSTNA